MNKRERRRWFDQWKQCPAIESCDDDPDFDELIAAASEVLSYPLGHASEGCYEARVRLRIALKANNTVVNNSVLDEDPADLDECFRQLWQLEADVRATAQNSMVGMSFKAIADRLRKALEPKKLSRVEGGD